MCIVYRFINIIALMVVLVAALTMTFSSVVLADDNGLASVIHTLKKEHRKTCMVGHFHYGASKKQKTRRMALKAAKRSWMSFVAFEYGSDWASFRKSANKGKLCTKADDHTYGCRVSARPCRR